MLAPGSRIGPISAADRHALIAASPVAGKYDQALDRESAYEVLTARAQSPQASGAAGQSSTAAAPGTGPGAGAARPAAAGGGGGGVTGAMGDFLLGSTGPRGGHRDGVVQSVAKSMMRNAANQIVRGLLGSLIGRR
ncbi:hypothetical protein CDEF62S_01500 [Castellaniella defragrans]